MKRRNIKCSRYRHRAARFGALLLLALGSFASAQDVVSLCAEVRLEIRQELTTERQAFDARMRIGNGLPALALENIDIDLIFTDDLGNAVSVTSDPNNTNAVFFVRVDTMENIADVSGSGRVDAATEAEIHWLIIPTPGAAGASPLGRRYEVGATVNYTLGGEPDRVEVVPDSIVVRPTPLLVLDYFIPERVYADDAFTPEVEPPIPFSLGVRVNNIGFGTAHALEIDSAQPVIVENELGLLVNFVITGSEIHGIGAPNRLRIDFGDIPGNTARAARWILQTDLSGEFTEFSAEYSHADELGGKVTSLLDDIRTHFLIRDVLVDLPGRDGVRDFLARDGAQVAVYESQGIDTPVTVHSNAVTLALVSQSGTRKTWTLDVPATAGPLYVEKPFENTDSLQIVSVTRSDGKRLAAANAWFSKARESGADPWDHLFQLFDVHGGGIYTLVVDDQAVGNRAPVLLPIGDRVTRIGDSLAFTVQASDPDGTIPSLGVSTLPSGASVAKSTNGLVAVGQFDWTPAAGQYGIYPLIFSAGDGELTAQERIRIFVGNIGEPADTNGIPRSLSGRSVLIEEVAAETGDATARIVWPTLPGIAYDIYYTDDPLNGAETWTLLVSNQVASGASEFFDDDTLGVDGMRRFYQVVLSGETPMLRGIWGVLRQDLHPGGLFFLAPPFRGTADLSAGFGERLSRELSGDDAGPGDHVGADVWVPDATGAWRILYLDAAGAWREVDGTLSDFVLQTGQGVILQPNQAGGARLTFTGEVGNDASQALTIVPGWNLITLSEGRAIPLAAAFASPVIGLPMGGTSVTNADRVVIWDQAAGVEHDLIYAQGLGPAFNGKWVDPVTMTVPPAVLQPGRAFYYYRRPSAGILVVTF